MIDATSATVSNGANEERDRGGILVFVMVVITISSLIVLPMLSYTSSVLKSGSIQSDRAQAIEFANGGNWVLMSNGKDLYDVCNGSNIPVPLNGVTTSCNVLDTATLRPATEMPFEVATVQADRQIPAAFVNGPATYSNPNIAADPGAWLTNADWTALPVNGKVWLPQLPVQATSPVVDAANTNRIFDMPAGTFDSNFASCRVFFPGTFDTPIVLDRPTYFTSGVYYFNQPITLRDGADVVVGNGEGLGCTNDYEAVSVADQNAPDPLNISSLGGTLVLGDQARIITEDDGSGRIRLAINQRYVSAQETSVAASSDVAIISVNGQHAPLAAGEALGDDLIVNGYSAVPASTVGTDGDPAAVDSDYKPSIYTAKAQPPDPAQITTVQAFQFQEQHSPQNDGVEDGIFRVEWTEPEDNGSLITSYRVDDTDSGHFCEVSAPTQGATVPTSCMIFDIEDNTRPELVITTTNDAGSTVAPSVDPNLRVDLKNGGQSTPIGRPLAPTNALIGTSYSDGVEITWDAPNDAGLMLTTGYQVIGRPNLGGPDITCEARFDETSCVLPLPYSAAPPPIFDIEVVTLSNHTFPAINPTGSGGGVIPLAQFERSDPQIVASLYTYAPGGSLAPPKPTQTATRTVTPILDFTTSTGTELDIVIDGYVSVPQGRILVSVANPANASVQMKGGVLAGDLDINPATAPSTMLILFDNPVAQKRVQLVSSYNGDARATSSAVVQINRSGSLAINSWVVQ